MRVSLIGKTIAAGAAVALSMAVSTPAEAVVYATGDFTYGLGDGTCFEAYAGTAVGLGSCAVSLSIGTFALAVQHAEDGTCSGVAPATLTITSPSTSSAPPARGLLLVSHGIGQFSGSGSSGLVVSVAQAKLSGSRCKPQNVLGNLQILKGNYELHA